MSKASNTTRSGGANATRSTSVNSRPYIPQKEGWRPSIGDSVSIPSMQGLRDVLVLNKLDNGDYRVQNEYGEKYITDLSHALGLSRNKVEKVYDKSIDANLTKGKHEYELSPTVKATITVQTERVVSRLRGVNARTSKNVVVEVEANGKTETRAFYQNEGWSAYRNYIKELNDRYKK